MITKLKKKLNEHTLLFVMFVMAFIATVFVSSTMMVRADGEEPEDWSFYTISSAASGYLNKALSPSGSGLQSASTLSIGDAGAFVGFYDGDTTGGVGGWISSKLSSSSDTRSYDSVMKVSVNSADSNQVTNSIYQYCRYGYLLASLGLDDVGTNMSGTNGVRMVSGFFILLLYYLASVVPAVFSIIIKVLKALNPFQLFSLADATTASWLTEGKYMDMGDLDESNPLYSLASVVSDWYDLLYDMSWEVLIPLFFAALVISVLLFKTTNKAKKIKKYCIRALFIVIGVPMCGSIYTSALTSMDNAMSGANTSATQVIASTFCDFESWASKNRLAVPSGAILESYNSSNANEPGKPSPKTEANLRSTCYAINRHSGAIPYTVYSSGSQVSGPLKDSDAIGDGVASTSVVNWNNTVLSSSEGGKPTGNTVGKVTDMLLRYMSSSFYYASDWESLVKSEITTVGQKTLALNMVNQSDSIDDYDITTGTDGTTNWAASRFGTMALWSDGTNYANIFANGGLTVDDAEISTSVYSMKFGDSSTVVTQRGSDISQSQGLSTLSMYNYLNTEFTKSSVITYSSEKASSGLVRYSHYSVNLIGTGVTSVLYYANAFVLLGSFVVIGFYYAFGLIMANLKRGIRLITSVPFAILGSIRSIAKVITYTIMLIIEVLMTMFVYVLVTEMLLQISILIEAPIAKVLEKNSLAFLTTGSSALIVIMIVISCIVIIAFTVMAFKMRKTIVKALDEGAADIINKFFDVNAMPEQHQPSLLQKAGSAVASGVGMGIGSKMSNGMNKNPNATGVSGSQKTIATGDGGIGPDGSPGGSGPMLDGKGQDALDGSVTGIEGSAGVSGGTPGIGTAASKVSDVAFAENNQEQADKSLSERLGTMGSLAGVSSMDDLKAKDEAKQLESDMALQEAMGNVSAMESEQKAEEESALKREQQKEALTQQATGVAQTAVGVAEGVGAAYTGDASLAQDSLKNVSNGVGAMADGKQNMMDAGTEAKAQVNAEQQAQLQAQREMQNTMQQQSASDEQRGVDSTGNSAGQSFQSETQSGLQSHSLSDSPVAGDNSSTGSVQQISSAQTTVMTGGMTAGQSVEQQGNTSYQSTSAATNYSNTRVSDLANNTHVDNAKTEITEQKQITKPQTPVEKNNAKPKANSPVTNGVSSKTPAQKTNVRKVQGQGNRSQNNTGMQSNKGATQQQHGQGSHQNGRLQQQSVQKDSSKQPSTQRVVTQTRTQSTQRGVQFVSDERVKDVKDRYAAIQKRKELTPKDSKDDDII